MDILILGGTGAMGKYLTYILSTDESNKIYVTSRRKYETKNNILFLYGNAHDDIFLNKILEKRSANFREINIKLEGGMRTISWTS